MMNKMKLKLSKRKPILVSILWALLILPFYVLGSILTQKMNMNDVNTKLVNGLCVFLAVFTAIIYIWKSDYSFSNIGFRKPEKNSSRSVFFYFPPIIIELLGFIAGFNFTINYLFSVIFFTIAVGFAEEIYFRGLIFKTLEVKGIKKAIIISSIIFGIMHLNNVLGGADILYTLIQIVYAFAFGFVFVEIFYLTKSLIPVILWHFIHDCLNYIQNTPDMQVTIIFGGIQAVILLIYAVYMWRKIDFKNAPIT